MAGPAPGVSPPARGGGPRRAGEQQQRRATPRSDRPDLSVQGLSALIPVAECPSYLVAGSCVNPRGFVVCPRDVRGFAPVSKAFAGFCRGLAALPGGRCPGVQLGTRGSGTGWAVPKQGGLAPSSSFGAFQWRTGWCCYLPVGRGRVPVPDQCPCAGGDRVTGAGTRSWQSPQHSRGSQCRDSTGRGSFARLVHRLITSRCTSKTRPLVAVTGTIGCWQRGAWGGVAELEKSSMVMELLCAPAGAGQGSVPSDRSVRWAGLAP